MTGKRASPSERVLRGALAAPGGCIRSRLSVNVVTGYVQVKTKGTVRGGHVVVYEAHVGPVPEGMVLDHWVCDNRWCVNHHHVRPATQRENILRGNGATAKRHRDRLDRESGSARLLA